MKMARRMIWSQLCIDSHVKFGYRLSEAYVVLGLVGCRCEDFINGAASSLISKSQGRVSINTTAVRPGVGLFCDGQITWDDGPTSLLKQAPDLRSGLKHLL